MIMALGAYVDIRIVLVGEHARGGDEIVVGRSERIAKLIAMFQLDGLSTIPNSMYLI